MSTLAAVCAPFSADALIIQRMRRSIVCASMRSSRPSQLLVCGSASATYFFSDGAAPSKRQPAMFNAARAMALLFTCPIASTAARG